MRIHPPVSTGTEKRKKKQRQEFREKGEGEEEVQDITTISITAEVGSDGPSINKRMYRERLFL